jgi:hypothetical protein
MYTLTPKNMYIFPSKLLVYLVLFIILYVINILGTKAFDPDIYKDNSNETNYANKPICVDFVYSNYILMNPHKIHQNIYNICSHPNLFVFVLQRKQLIFEATKLDFSNQKISYQL